MIGMILRNIRKMKGLTQKQISNKLNLAENTISNYETEISNPTFNVINKIANICDFEIQFVDKKNNKTYSIKELSKEMDF
ncbi:MAG: helix-turn-helix transcriptional regulator [Clostridia bacterium]|nr:helix-turn-helix transcriptional regulator [Clostridia bacterium]